MIFEKPTHTAPGKPTGASKFPPEEVREDWVPKEDYTSVEFAELERKYLWPRIWQVACREEDLPKTGSFVTYEILDESVIVTRTAEGEIKAYNNACLHRGRRLTEGEGKTPKFVCKFHGWSWNLQGENIRVVDVEDWGPCLAQKDMGLHEFKVGIWGGFVFINMDPNCESFETFLGDLPQRLDCLEFEKQRYRWYISVEVECNWKTAQEAFHEAYHVQTTHRGLAPYQDSRSDGSVVHGRHGHLQKSLLQEPVIGRYVGGSGLADQRLAFLESIRVNCRGVGSIITDQELQAAHRILTELPETATWMEAAVKGYEFMKEAAIASGVGYPDVTRHQMQEIGNVCTIFPNTSNVLASPINGLWYRFRPTPDNNPNHCIFELFSLERFTPGSEPKVEKQIFKNWRECKAMPSFLLEDFANIPDVQRGMRTKYFKAARTNPVLERIISNMHEQLREFIQEGIEAERRADSEKP